MRRHSTAKALLADAKQAAKRAEIAAQASQTELTTALLRRADAKALAQANFEHHHNAISAGRTDALAKLHAAMRPAAPSNPYAYAPCGQIKLFTLIPSVHALRLDEDPEEEQQEDAAAREDAAKAANAIKATNAGKMLKLTAIAAKKMPRGQQPQEPTLEPDANAAAAKKMLRLQRPQPDANAAPVQPGGPIEPPTKVGS